VIVDVQLESLGILDTLYVCRQGLELDRVACSNAFIIFGARICGCSSRNIPHVIPVSVDITADA
jgi:hypothetical protein